MIDRFFFGILLILWSSVTIAQSEKARSEPDYHWMQTYTGWAGSGIAGGLSINLNFDNILYRASLHRYESEFLNIFGPPAEVLTTINLQAGYIIKSGVWFFTLSGGFGYGQYIDPVKIDEGSGWFSTGIYEYRKYGQLSVPLEAQASLCILQIVNISMQAGFHLSSNASHPYVGLGIGFGKFF